MNNKFPKKVQTNEWYAVILSFVYFFCVLAAYYVMRPIREQLSAAVGSTQLPWFFTGTFLATLLLTPIFSWAASKWSRRIVVPLVYVFFIGCLLLFIPLFTFPDVLKPRTLGILFFVWVSVFNLFVVSVFWSFMTDIWSDEQSRRLFPIIALGGATGAILGPIITRSLVQMIGIPPLLIISAALLVGALICVVILGQWASVHGAHKDVKGCESALGGNMFDGLKFIFNNHFIRTMAILMLLGDAIGTIAYALITDYSNVTFSDAIARTKFAADIDLSTNVLQIIVQLTLTRWLLVRAGAGPVFAVWSIITLLTCLAMSLSSHPYTPVIGQMPWVAILIIVTRSLTYAMAQPAQETLFTLVPRTLRYKGKNAVDTVVWRAGDVVSSVSINGLHAIGMSLSGFGIIGAALLATSGIIAWCLAKQTEH